MKDVIETYTDPTGFAIEIHQDDSGDCDPREFDNLGTLVCWHRRCGLGHRNITSPGELAGIMPKNAIKLPVYLYEHSGMTISLEPFDDPWDSGQVGWIFASRETVRKEYSCTEITPEIREKVLSVFAAEIKTYDAYLRGEVFGYVVKDPEGNDLDSCWGFIGEADYCMTEGKAALKSALEAAAVQPNL